MYPSSVVGTVVVSTPAAGVNMEPFSVPLMYTVAPAVPEKPDTVLAREKAVPQEI